MSQGVEAERAATVAPAAREEAEPLSDLAYQMHAQAFQQISLLAMAAAGGALVMFQSGVFKVRPWTAILAAIILAFAALAGVIGSMTLTRGATEGLEIRKQLRIMQMLAFFLLGAGTGVLVMGLLRNAFP